MFLSLGAGESAMWFNITGSAVLVYFLSLGAPNQPGGILVGTMTLLRYRGLAPADFMFITIFFVAAFGILQNLINVIGDIVTVAIEEQKMKNTP